MRCCVGSRPGCRLPRALLSVRVLGRQLRASHWAKRNMTAFGEHEQHRLPATVAVDLIVSPEGEPSSAPGVASQDAPVR